MTHNDARMRIGFIGLGIMGLPMARNLAEAGYTVFAYTRTPARGEPLRGAGATFLGSPAEVAASADVVITMLPDSADVAAVFHGPEGIRDGAHQGLIWIDMSSISPRVSRELASEASEAGIRALDAPVSGGQQGAEAGALAIMVGGDRELFSIVEPLLSHLGRTVVLVGGPGAGQIAKVCNQLVIGATIAGVAEALTLAAKSNVDPRVVRDVLMGGLAGSRVLESHGLRMLEANYVPGFRLTLHQKDLSNVMDAARTVGSPAPVAAVALQLMNALVGAGFGDLDNASLALAYERLSGTSISHPT